MAWTPSKENRMTMAKDMSRRRFVNSAISSAAISCMPIKGLLAGYAESVPTADPLRQQSGSVLTDSAAWKDQGVENLQKSPYSKLHNVPVRAVTIGSGFWGRRRDINVTKGIPSMHDLLESNGRMINFRRLADKSKGDQRGPVFSDSDIYKWTEAVGFALQSGDRPEMRSMSEKFIDDVVAVQEPSGYLNTYYVDDRVSQRMLTQTQTTGHELYNLGHMLQGAIAYYRGTGDHKMLDAGIRFVNHFLLPDYGPAPKKPIVSGHPEIEMGLIELYRMTGNKMYVTGGVGSRAAGEAFGDAYELPNYRAYGESCAAIGNMMWNWRMLAATGDAKFTDVIERALYNGINSGMSLDGTLYCYRNPLAFDPSNGDKIRNPWYDTTCCPPNLERTFASLPGYFYSTSGDGIYLHLYDNSELDWHLENGTDLKVTQKTNYPWDGSVEIAVVPAAASHFTFYLRIPGWAERMQVSVNGKALAGAKPGEYLPIQRRWSPGDAIRLQMEMTPQMIQANPRLVDDTGRVAIQRGPLVYCMEELDQPNGVALADVAVDLDQKAGAVFHGELRSDLLGGVHVLRHMGAVYDKTSSSDALYSRYKREPVKTRRVPLTFIPYYAWANRQTTPMPVWTPVLKSLSPNRRY